MPPRKRAASPPPERAVRPMIALASGLRDVVALLEHARATGVPLPMLPLAVAEVSALLPRYTELIATVPQRNFAPPKLHSDALGVIFDLLREQRGIATWGPCDKDGVPTVDVARPCGIDHLKLCARRARSLAPLRRVCKEWARVAGRAVRVLTMRNSGNADDIIDVFPNTLTLDVRRPMHTDAHRQRLSSIVRAFMQRPLARLGVHHHAAPYIKGGARDPIDLSGAFLYLDFFEQDSWKFSNFAVDAPVEIDTLTGLTTTSVHTVDDEYTSNLLRSVEKVGVDGPFIVSEKATGFTARVVVFSIKKTTRLPLAKSTTLFFLPARWVDQRLPDVDVRLLMEYDFEYCNYAVVDFLRALYAALPRNYVHMIARNGRELGTQEAERLLERWVSVANMGARPH